ncbi:MAG: hypothetical protein EWV66_20820 [Microcystis sp. M_OC_Ca_00000000_C217Col]|nr:MAG: hypothetical protein EWV66_20820 [Microcystis sp. M_OC_Ca_00000000_C217Col]
MRWHQSVVNIQGQFFVTGWNLSSSNLVFNDDLSWLFGLCYAMDGGYKGCNPYIERHLAIFVNCFLSRAN